MAEEETKSAGPIRMVAIENMVMGIRTKAQVLARTNKLESGIMGGGVVAFSIGMGISLLLVVVPVVVLG